VRFVEIVTELTGQDEWIIDGHYRNVRHHIWSKADTVIWLNYPLAVVAARLVRRRWEKPKMAMAQPSVSSAGSNDLTPLHVNWRDRIDRLARTLRERREYGRLLHAPQYRGLRIVELRSPRDSINWLQALPAES
jgi:adenylate kinase family enzyme